eukprot:m.34713 g.34713  ORF g.34713 m.34713 type:complete len:403 (-) comp7358_c0_seq1:172-1380(-)
MSRVLASISSKSSPGSSDQSRTMMGSVSGTSGRSSLYSSSSGMVRGLFRSSCRPPSFRFDWARGLTGGVSGLTFVTTLNSPPGCFSYSTRSFFQYLHGVSRLRVDRRTPSSSSSYAGVIPILASAGRLRLAGVCFADLGREALDLLPLCFPALDCDLAGDFFAEAAAAAGLLPTLPLPFFAVDLRAGVGSRNDTCPNEDSGSSNESSAGSSGIERCEAGPARSSDINLGVVASAGVCTFRGESLSSAAAKSIARTGVVCGGVGAEDLEAEREERRLPAVFVTVRAEDAAEAGDLVATGVGAEKLSSAGPSVAAASNSSNCGPSSSSDGGAGITESSSLSSNSSSVALTDSGSLSKKSRTPARWSLSLRTPLTATPVARPRSPTSKNAADRRCFPFVLAGISN